MSFGIIVKNYEHHNRSFGNWDTPKGKYIRTKRQYMNEIAKGGYVTLEESHRLSEQNKTNKRIKLGISSKAKAIINTARQTKDSKGRVKLGDRTIDTLKDMGVSFDSQWCPKHYSQA